MITNKIKSIVVEKLFGVYDYTLTIPSDTKDNVFILYGDNGTGKSTILRLVYHLLSTEPGCAHKTKLANIAFKSITVIFDNETVVRAERDDKNEDYLGDYNLIFRNSTLDLQCHATSSWSEESHRYKINFTNDDSDNRMNYHCILMKLRSINVFYISDNRINISRVSMDVVRHRRALKLVKIRLNAFKIQVLGRSGGDFYL